MTNVFALIRPLDFSEYNVPFHTQESLTNYVQHGYMPGGFLTSLLCNDLMGQLLVLTILTNKTLLKSLVLFSTKCLQILGVPLNEWKHGVKRSTA